MSSSNAAAIRRRVGQQTSNTPPSTQQTNTKTTSSNQMSIQQVITIMDKRMKQLENIAETNSKTEDLSAIVDEFNNRFEMIVTELNSLKDTVLQLQTYTMDVNKTLFNERIQILSDLGNNPIISTDISKQTSADSLYKQNEQEREQEPEK